MISGRISRKDRSALDVALPSQNLPVEFANLPFERLKRDEECTKGNSPSTQIACSRF